MRWVGMLVLFGCATPLAGPAEPKVIAEGDLASAPANDLTRPPDLGAPAAPDLDEAPPDPASAPDLATPPDLLTPRDLAAPRDLSTPHDLTAPPPDLSTNPCAYAAYGNGAYCGESLPTGVAGWLYQCSGGGTTGKTQCLYGCQVNAPGTNDNCRTSATDPCASAASGSGAYCGQSLSGGDYNWLYQCSGGVTTSKMQCPNGCQQNGSGVPDNCIA